MARTHDVALVDGLVSLGVFTEETAYGYLARACRLELVPLRDVSPSRMTLKLVPATLARRHLMAPLASDARTLAYATCQPFDATADADVTLATGRHAARYLAMRSDVVAALDRFYPHVSAPERLIEDARRTHAPRPLPTFAPVSTTTTTPATQSVLIADDEPIARMALRLLLEQHQYTVFEAADSAQALAVSRCERPSLAFVDLSMRQVDGVHVIERIRANREPPAMPIIVLTEASDPDVERQVLDLGADDYVVKPFDAAVLLARVNAAFRRLRLATA